jgi:serine beta-lactamase-like protein LACTB
MPTGPGEMPFRKTAHHRGSSVFAALLLAVLLIGSTCQAQDATLSPYKRSQMESAISAFMAKSKAPGTSVAVVEDGKIVWSAGFGMADLENSVPATPQTLYRLASISKSLTATAAMLLWERGKLDLDVPVQKYCPAFPQKEYPITTRELMAQLGGIRYYHSESQDDPEIGNTEHFEHPIKAGLDFFKNDPLIAKPGTEYHYSTQGYTLVGCAIEGASGKSYTDFLRENVFVPAGMSSTRADDRFAIIPHRTDFYHRLKNGRIVNADFLDASYKIPGGGWLSSAEDMARFEIALLDNKLIQPATRKVMWTPQKARKEPDGPYALGWRTATNKGVNTYWHSGGQQGTSTFFEVEPQSRKGVVILCNLDHAGITDIGAKLMTIVLQEK